MNHAELCGSHRELGFQYGSRLAERGKFILKQVPFPLTEERRNFAAACVPVYRRFFPEILEELEGLAAGQRCPAEDLAAVLFSMYALPPSCCCSCFAVSRDGAVLFGRNSDFLTALEEQNLNVICRPAGAVAFTGNTTAFLEMEDGVNQHGLAVGLTSVASQAALRPGFQAGLLVRLLLEAVPVHGGGAGAARPGAHRLRPDPDAGGSRRGHRRGGVRRGAAGGVPPYPGAALCLRHERVPRPRDVVLCGPGGGLLVCPDPVRYPDGGPGRPGGPAGRGRGPGPPGGKVWFPLPVRPADRPGHGLVRGL